MRWLVLGSLSFAIYRAYTGFRFKRPFTKSDDAIRHWTATIAHIQLAIGIYLYTQSPLVKVFWKSGRMSDSFFFSVLHFLLMLTAIVIITIGSAMAKRKSPDREKFRTQLIWFSVALVIILVAIPWPFSPLSQRPYIRTL